MRACLWPSANTPRRAQSSRPCPGISPTTRTRCLQAVRWYDEVTSGELYLQAQIRYALVLNKEGKLDAARAHLHQVQADSIEGRAQLVLAEAQMLREANRPQEAFDLIGAALKKMPDQPDLLYDYAMVAEKLGRMDVLETSLKTLIRLQPDHAQA